MLRGEGQEGQGEPKSEEAYKAEAKEAEQFAQYYADLPTIYDIEKDIRELEKNIVDVRKRPEGDVQEQIPYYEHRIEAAKAEIEKRKEQQKK